VNTDALENIPRLVTALAEWSTCVLYISLVRRRLGRFGLGLALGSGLLVIVAIHQAAGAAPRSLWAVGMGAAVLAMYGVIRACAETDRMGSADLVVRAFVLAELVASFAWQIDQLVLGHGAPVPARGAVIFAVAALLLGAAWLAERRNFPRDLRVAVDGRMLAATVAIALAALLMSNISFVNAETPFSSRGWREAFYIRTLVDLSAFIALYAIRSQRLQLQRAIETRSMNSLLHSQHQQYLRSREARDAVNSKYHDLKHYIAAIREESGSSAQVEMVDQLESSLRGYSAAAVDTGNGVVDTVLGAKITQAESEGITMTSVVDGSALDFMDVMDIVSVFGNALDNALEACVAEPDEDRRLVRVAVYRQGNFVILRFENWFGGELALYDGLPATTKDDAQHHGYGLKNIRDVADRYEGSMTVETRDEWFVLRLMIPVTG